MANAILATNRMISEDITVNSVVNMLPTMKMGENDHIIESVNRIRKALSEVNPNMVDSSVLRFLPIIGRFYKKYRYSNLVTKFENAKSVTDGIRGSLEESFMKLYNESEMLAGNIKSLEDSIQAKKNKLETWKQEFEDYKAEHKNDTGSDREISVNKEFMMSQDIIDLQQVIAVEEQCLVTIVTIIKNNNELMGSINRANRVTVTALGNAIVLAQILDEQNKVYNCVDTLNKETDNLIKYSSEQLKTQGTKIMKQAASAQLSIDALKTSFNNIIDAYNEVENFRANSLNTLNSNIKQLDNLLTSEKIQNYIKSTTEQKKLSE